MELQHIELSKLKVSKCNMRYHDAEPDISDILPSIRAKGVLQPLIVRAEDGRFGVVAGRRRYFSLKAVKSESGEVAAPPCAIMEEGDDAEAIELSLLENVARRDADPMREYETFVRLIKEGRTIDGISSTFGMTTTQVRQRLALGNLLPRIREAYRAEEIDDETVRHLTLASPSQQKKWLRLFSDPHQHAPCGYQLKQWLFGGQQISTTHALFKRDDYTGLIIEDLFGEDSYFADADLFWALQNRAIAAKRDQLLKSGWSAVEVLEIGQHFTPYEHVKTPKKKGGKVFVSISHDGAVTIYDGWLTQKEAKRLAKKPCDKNADDTENMVPRDQPAITNAMRNYQDLHRLGIARLALLAQPDAAWRLAVAHMAVPSGNWLVKADPQRPHNAAIGKSVEASPAQRAVDAERQEVEALLGWTSEEDERSVVTVFAKLLTLDDRAVQRIAAFFMAITLEAGSDAQDEVGAMLQADARSAWQADDCYLDLVRDRATLSAMVEEVAGEAVAKATLAEKAKTLRGILRDCLAGTGGRAQVAGWLPGWIAFPPQQKARQLPLPDADRIAAE